METKNLSKPPDNSNNPELNEIQQDFVLNALNQEASLNKQYEKTLYFNINSRL